MSLKKNCLTAVAVFIEYVNTLSYDYNEHEVCSTSSKNSISFIFVLLTFPSSLLNHCLLHVCSEEKAC